MSDQKRIEIFYKAEVLGTTFPSTEVLEGETAGYKLMNADNGGIPTYRIWAGRKTVLVPAGNVLKVEMEI